MHCTHTDVEVPSPEPEEPETPKPRPIKYVPTARTRGYGDSEAALPLGNALLTHRTGGISLAVGVPDDFGMSSPLTPMDFLTVWTREQQLIAATGRSCAVMGSILLPFIDQRYQIRIVTRQLFRQCEGVKSSNRFHRPFTNRSGAFRSKSNTTIL